ncbi:KAT8 regulatory NSL complex subunit 3 [Hordeum vulgare subsp. vulgare]|uniref:KANL3/Tex30 alpha/beta hydrolase-like domain-containing protein n=1 Tax=Hordeum vulgare subsp. vulgare TaxID=112509 RepID=A0A8I6Z0T3_HORVV|nr:KAT8 regulatory NSL complex subunit 3 [Hordeum vulgare subsp. vulgare]
MARKRRRADQRTTAPSPPPPLRTKLTHRQPVVVFAHGAGAPSSSDWMTHWKEMVKDALDAIEVVTFDYPYMSGGKRRPPPKADKLVDHHLSVVKNAVAEHPGHPLVLMGKSMGSRVSCMVASSDGICASAVICLGYPLKGAKGVMRDEILLKLIVPTMFVQGNKDGLCPLNKLELVRKKMTCKNELHVVDGGDHSFKISQKYQKSAGINQHDIELEAVKAIEQFVQNSIAESLT